jgi:hypothetical protein
MTKKILLLLILSSGLAKAQSNAIPNGGFELWNEIPLTETLDNWQTSNSQGIGVCLKKEDAQDLNYSVYLETKAPTEDGDLSFGYVSFGDIDNGSGAPYSDAVDSLVFYAKYQIQPGDSAIAVVIQIDATGAETYNILSIGGENSTSFERFAMKMNAPAQEKIIVAFASSNAFADEGFAGSWIQLDNVSFNHTSSTPSPIDNYSFENWTTPVMNEAEDWYSTNAFTYLFGIPENVSATTDAFEGSYAAKLVTSEIGSQGDYFEGYLTLGSDDFGAMYPLDATPTNFSGAYKANINGTEGAYITLFFFENETLVAQSYIEINETEENYVTFNEELNLTNQIDSIQLICSSGMGIGNVLFLDDLALTGGDVGITENPFSIVTVFPNPVCNEVYFDFNTAVSNIKIMNTHGAVLSAHVGQGNTSIIDVRALPTGTYFYEAATDQGFLSRGSFIKR